MKISLIFTISCALFLGACSSMGTKKLDEAKPAGPKYSAYYQSVMDNSHKICNYIPQIHAIENILAFFIADDLDDALAEHKISQAVAYICRAVNAAQRLRGKAKPAPQQIAVEYEDENGAKQQMPLGGQFTKKTKAP